MCNLQTLKLMFMLNLRGVRAEWGEETRILVDVLCQPREPRCIHIMTKFLENKPYSSFNVGSGCAADCQQECLLKRLTS